jgi:S1-C subfamily serine protease
MGARTARVALVLLIALVATALADPSPQQRVAMQAKPSVVRVWGAYIATYQLAGEKIQQAIGGSGTGFFITPDGYIATNAHVVSDVHDGDDAAKEALYKLLLKELDRVYAKEISRMSDGEIERLLRSIKLVNLEKRAYVVLPNGDKLDYKIEQYGKPGSGRDAAIIKVKTENAPTLPIGDSTRTQVADQIVVLGYPGVADMKVLLDEKSQLQCSVTDGAISSLKRASSGEQILQISAPITHGNSGGPALDLKGNVIGLATFGNEGEIQGFNFLVASGTLKEILKDGKIEPKASETNKLWQEGLTKYWASEYSAAITKFQEVESLFPAHSEAPSLIRESITAKKEGKEKTPSSGGHGLVIGLIVGGIVVVGGGAFALSRRGQGGPRPMPQHGQMHPGQMHPGMPHTPPPPMAHGGPHTPMPMMGPPGMPPPQHGFPPPPQQHGFPPPQQQGFPPPQQQGFPPPQQQMYGRVPSPSQPPPMGFGPPQQQGFGMQPQPQGQPPGAPIAKTMAIQGGQPQPAGGIAPTAFGSLSIGSLTCVRGQLMNQRFALTATGIIVGRQPGVAHVLVNDHRASGKHVWIGVEQGRLVAIDQGTTNGTYVNDVTRGRITKQELRDGDVVIVGEPDCLSLQIKLG